MYLLYYPWYGAGSEIRTHVDLRRGITNPVLSTAKGFQHKIGNTLPINLLSPLTIVRSKCNGREFG